MSDLTLDEITAFLERKLRGAFPSFQGTDRTDYRGMAQRWAKELYARVAAPEPRYEDEQNTPAPDALREAITRFADWWSEQPEFAIEDEVIDRYVRAALAGPQEGA
jgi:hypothetical protein